MKYLNCFVVVILTCAFSFAANSQSKSDFEKTLGVTVQGEALK